MGFFKKKGDDSRARRSNRLRFLQIRQFGLVFGVVFAVVAMGYAGYRSGSFTRISNWAVGGTLDYTASMGFKVKDILVKGRSTIPADQLLAQLSIKQNEPIFGISIADAQKSLTTMPWVKDVSISRRLPDTIIISLQERTPVALWQYQKKISLIDATGVVLPVAALDAYRDLPLVVGEDAPANVQQLIALLHAEPAIAAEMTSATRVGGRRWDLRLRNNVSVKLPEQNTELALRTLAQLQEQKNIFQRDITVIDLRQPERMVVTPVATNNTKDGDEAANKNKKLKT